MGFAPKDRAWMTDPKQKCTVSEVWLEQGIGKAIIVLDSTDCSREVLIKDLYHVQDFSSPSAKGQ